VAWREEGAVALRLLRQNQQAVDQALIDGEYDTVLHTSTQRLDQFVGLMQATGLFDLLPLLKPLARAGDVPEEMLLRELAVMPLLQIPNVHQAGHLLLGDPAVLRFLGFTVEQIQDGFPHRGRHGAARPHHRDLLYNLLGALRMEELETFRAAWVRRWAYDRHSRSLVWALDGTDVGGRYKLLLALNLSDGDETVGNWRLLPADCGSELPGGREMVDELLAVLPKGQLRLLLMDGMYIDGAWLRRLKQEHGIDALVRLRSDMNAYEDALQMVRADPSLWQSRARGFTAGGTKSPRRYEIATIPVVCWESYGAEVQVILIRPEGAGEEETWALVTTILDPDGWALFRQYGQRWWLENRGNRELKEAYGLERELWSESEEAAHLSVYLRLISYNLVQLYRRGVGEKLAGRGLRSLRQRLWRGPEIVVIVGEEFGLYQIEEFAALCGGPPRTSLRARAP
jgi:Transposase DDE domain